MTCVAPLVMQAQSVGIPRLSEEPILDGSPDVAEWQSALRLKNFVVLGSEQQPAGKATHVSVAYGEKGIYVAFEGVEPEMTLLLPSKEDGAAVLRGESIELMMTAPPKGEYYHFAVSPDGARFNSRGPRNTPIPLGNWQVVAQRKGDRWSAECLIPYSHFGLAGPVAGPWQLNVGRTTFFPTREYSLWRHVPGLDQDRLGFHQPAFFQEATLVGAPAGGTDEVALVQEAFDTYPSGAVPKPEWVAHVYGSGEVVIDEEYFYRDAHPDRSTGKSLRFTRESDRAGSSVYRAFGGALPESARRVTLRAAAMSTVEESIFYPIVIGNWAGKVGFGKQGQFLYTRKDENGREEVVQVGSYRPLQWYRFEVEVDLLKATYDLRIDGEPVAEAVPLPGDIAQWDRYLASTGGGEGGDSLQVFYLDEVEAVASLSLEETASNAPEEVLVEQQAVTAVTAEVRGFGEQINYGQAESRLRGVFPLGLSFNVGYELGEREWRWYGSRTHGRVDALQGWMSFRDLVIDFEERGEYEVSLLMEKAQMVGGIALPGVQIGKGQAFDKIVPRFHESNVQWIPWKKVQIDDEPLTIRHSRGNSAAIHGLRLSLEGKPVITYTGESFLELLRKRNDVFEEKNPEDVIRYLRRWLPKLKTLNVRTLDLSGTSSPEGMKAALDQAQEHGMNVILQVDWFFGPIRKALEALAPDDIEAGARLVRQSFGSLVEAVRDHPALLAYRVADEPFAEEAPVYRHIYQTLREMDPLHPVISIQCRSSWDPTAQSRRGGDNMKRFIEGVGEEVLLNDLYPIRYPASEVAAHLDLYVEAMEDSQRQAGGRPFWMMPQAICYANELRHPTPAEIRVQAYLSLAGGAQGLIYWKLSSRDTSIADADGQLNASGRELGLVLGEIAPLTPLFLQLKRHKLEMTLPREIAIGGFRSEEGKHYLVVVNKDVNHRRTLNLTLPSSLATRVKDLKTGVILMADKPGQPLRLEIAAGDGHPLELLP